MLGTVLCGGKFASNKFYSYIGNPIFLTIIIIITSIFILLIFTVIIDYDYKWDLFLVFSGLITTVISTLSIMHIMSKKRKDKLNKKNNTTQYFQVPPSSYLGGNNINNYKNTEIISKSPIKSNYKSLNKYVQSNSNSSNDEFKMDDISKLTDTTENKDYLKQLM